MITAPILNSSTLHYFTEHRIWKGLLPPEGLRVLISRPGSDYAIYAEETQLRQYNETFNPPSIQPTPLHDEIACLQGAPNPEVDRIVNRLLAETGQTTKYSSDVPDLLWELMVPFLVPCVRTKSGGSPQTPLRTMINGIFYRTKTGCQWSLLPREFGSKSAVHEFYQRMNSTGVLEKTLALVSLYYEFTNGYDFKWQSADGTLMQAPARTGMNACEGFGSNPTDRGRKGTKLHVRCDANGVPIAIEIKGANIHDSKILEDNFKNIFAPFERLEGPVEGEPQHMCLDAAYVGQPIAELLSQSLLVSHVRPRNEEKKEVNTFPPRRYVVERLMAWLKGFRSLRTRYTCYLQNFMGDIRLASIKIIWRKIAKMI